MTEFPLYNNTALNIYLRVSIVHDVRFIFDVARWVKAAEVHGGQTKNIYIYGQVICILLVDN
jgi:hypothetical protein